MPCSSGISGSSVDSGPAADSFRPHSLVRLISIPASFRPFSPGFGLFSARVRLLLWNGTCRVVPGGPRCLFQTFGSAGYAVFATRIARLEELGAIRRGPGVAQRPADETRAGLHDSRGSD